MEREHRSASQAEEGFEGVLRDDGVTYHEYVTELTYILFLKMAQETGADTILV